MPLFLISRIFFIIVFFYSHIFDLFFYASNFIHNLKKFLRLLYYLLCLGYSPIVWVSDDSH